MWSDMDGDGIPDLTTGSGSFASESHLDPDPAIGGRPAGTGRFATKGDAEFVPELIHNRSGVGSQFVVRSEWRWRSDVVTGNVKGTFVF